MSTWHAAGSRHPEFDVFLCRFSVFSTSRVQQLEQDLAQTGVVKDGLKGDKEKYLKFLEELGSTMSVDQILHDVGFDMHADALLSR